MNADNTSGCRYIILFDGKCNLCNNVISFIRGHDSRKIFCYIPLESEMGSEYISRFTSKGAERGSVLLIQDDNIYLKSSAVLHILKNLDGLWPLFFIFIIVPRFIRDPVYEIIARYRYRWFGSRT